MKFTEQEIEALKSIVAGWINEGFTTPPYQEIYYDLFEKLELNHPTEFQYNTLRPSITEEVE